jgi:serine/threonine protein kinase
VVKVLDFGVCKVQEPGDDLRTELGAPVGSLAYMAPEQAAGEADIDGRADLWSLGAVLFEMLAGRRLFQGSRMNLIRQLLYDPLPSFASALPGADPGVVAVVARCLAREREERWATADDVARALSDACLRAEHSEGPRTRVSFSRADLPASPTTEGLRAHLVSEVAREGAPPVPRSATLVLGPPRLESWPDHRVRPPAPAAPVPAPRESWSSLPGDVAHGPPRAAPPPPPRDVRQSLPHVGAVTVRMSGEEALRSAAEGLSARPSASPPLGSSGAFAALPPLVPGPATPLPRPSAPGFAAFTVTPAPAPPPPRDPAVPGFPAPSGVAALPSWFAAASAVALVVLLGVILFLMS